MLSKKDIAAMKRTGKLELNVLQELTHFSIVLYLFALPILVVGIYAYHLFAQSEYSFEWTIVLLAAILTALGAIAYAVQRDRLKFQQTQTALSWEQLAHIFKALEGELNWKRAQIRRDVYVAKTRHAFPLGSWGEQITIIKNGQHLWINSICDPDRRSSVSSLGKNRLNVRRFLEEVKKMERELGVSRF